LESKAVGTEVCRGLRLPDPQRQQQLQQQSNEINSEDQLYTLMINCWQVDPEERPTFAILSDQLRQIQQVIIKYKTFLKMH